MPGRTLPIECARLGRSCGIVPLERGLSLDCGECGSGEVCGADGVENTCCLPTTCREQNAACGSISDSCGGVLECGDCEGDAICGGAGVANQCGTASCRTRTCEELGFACGHASDGCGGVLECGTCPDGQACGADGNAHLCGVEPDIEAPSKLATNCFGVPGQPFSASNFASPTLGFAPGDRAVDFELADVHGVKHRLSDLYRDKPVVLLLGSRTCPVYQNRAPGFHGLALHYGDEARFVIVYTVEAHPDAPDPSPYRGRTWLGPYSDGVRKALDYETRKQRASELVTVPEELVLVDDYGDRANPVWCTYGPSAAAAYLISRGGIIRSAHLWLDVPSMERDLREELALDATN